MTLCASLTYKKSKDFSVFWNSEKKYVYNQSCHVGLACQTERQNSKTEVGKPIRRAPFAFWKQVLSSKLHKLHRTLMGFDVCTDPWNCQPHQGNAHIHHYQKVCYTPWQVFLFTLPFGVLILYHKILINSAISSSSFSKRKKKWKTFTRF